MSDLDPAYEALKAKVEALKAELPGITFGYLGNYERWGNDTHWYIFLPHFGRVGTYSDQVSIGAGRNDDTFTKALENWDKIEAAARRMYASVPNRLGIVYLKNNLIVDASGKAIGLGINPPPRFDSEEQAAAYLKSYQVPAVLTRS